MMKKLAPLYSSFICWVSSISIYLSLGSPWWDELFLLVIEGHSWSLMYKPDSTKMLHQNRPLHF